MNTPNPWLLLALPAALSLAACDDDDNGGSTPDAPPTQVSSLRFIGEKIVPYRQQYNSTTLGGFSGIDYRADNDTYYIMCDDASAIQPTRYYTAKLNFSATSFSDVTFTGVTTMKRPDGTPFPSAAADPANTLDPEGIRYDAASNHLIWSSEGVRNVTATPAVLIQPYLREANLDGTHVAEFPLPPLFRIQATDNGTRSNGSFEGMSITPGGKYVYTASEEPLYEDGPRAAPGAAGATIRILKYDRATKQVAGQYAYKLDAVHATPVPSNQFQLNGVVEVLALTETRLLVMERSFAVGATPDYKVVLYEVDLSNATDVSSLTALTGTNYTPAVKRQVLDLATIGLARVDNLEGMTFGPKLPNGHYSLVIVSDDNFGSSQVSQFLAFEVNP
ncbi:esterase-like activity of phytase family protein [Hymenobacter sp. 15J16-1T3B]|uniref:esterase-like activity of phytase family protein n=1 Tax=Hymenobacter sp. 15J16-1T3B TaxID=2886941 RepID=UPI001D11C362|nr:esterase-like activity of phytase family protein [Hymenobacter sp. 15J16-1T3B]MCC3156763.1 esterase-like activity of phytase family protein [Hymenobacter sp. 15J16-1T3B]